MQKDGNLVQSSSIARYKPYGGYLTQPTATALDRGYTGHDRTAADDGLGLVYMNARYLDSSTGRFISADTLVPEPGNPQAFNRYSYALGNPLSFNDRSGHCANDVASDIDCWDAYRQAHGLLGAGFEFLSQWGLNELNNLLRWLNNGVSFTRDIANGANWTSAQMMMAVNALDSIANAIGDFDITKAALGLTSGVLTLHMCPVCDRTDINHDYNPASNTIRFDDAGQITLVEMLHELGHSVDHHLAQGRRTWWSETGFSGLGWRRRYWLIGDWVPVQGWASNSTSSKQEDFADSFAAWVLDETGQQRPSFLNPMPRERRMRLINALSNLAP